MCDRGHQKDCLMLAASKETPALDRLKVRHEDMTFTDIVNIGEISTCLIQQI